MSGPADDPVSAMFAQLIEAQRRSTERMLADNSEELLATIGLDDEALRVWASHVEHNAIPDASLGAAFCGGVLLALELVAMRAP